MDTQDVPRIPALRVTPDQARPLPNDPGYPSTRVMSHGSMEVRWYVPSSGGRHLPHDRDELYFIVSGTANFSRSNEADPFDEAVLFVLGAEQIKVQPGDVLFVPAGAEHGFDECSPDFATWAVFYGPEGGERE